ncbi:MAG TPA: hypothetical protein V6C52_09375 [Coleofasciculaceae cyanobacterium]|jgi:hypothetical protein
MRITQPTQFGGRDKISKPNLLGQQVALVRTENTIDEQGQTVPRLQEATLFKVTKVEPHQGRKVVKDQVSVKPSQKDAVIQVPDIINPENDGVDLVTLMSERGDTMQLLYGGYWDNAAQRVINISDLDQYRKTFQGPEAGGFKKPAVQTRLLTMPQFVNFFNNTRYDYERLSESSDPANPFVQSKTTRSGVINEG